MQKSLDMYIRNLPETSSKKGIDKHLVFLGKDYGNTPVRTSACGVFKGSDDKKTCAVEFRVGTPNSFTVLQNIAEVESRAVLFLDTAGFYLMDRVTAMELCGQLSDV